MCSITDTELPKKIYALVKNFSCIFMERPGKECVICVDCGIELNQEIAYMCWKLCSYVPIDTSLYHDGSNITNPFMRM